MYGVGVNVELPAESFQQHLQPLDLVIRRQRRDTVADQADADHSLGGRTRPCGRLPLPSLRGLNLAVAGADAVADDEMTVQIGGIGQAARLGQPLHVAPFRSTEEYVDAAPPVGGLV